MGNCVEPTNLWELGKQVVVTCSGIEKEVIKEIQSMEERDNEVMRKYEKGTKKDFL